jgi:hypothetical protein
MQADTLEIAVFQSSSSGHRPVTHLRLLHDGTHLHGLYHVRDQCILCTHMEYQSDVYMDSCVEAFIQPKPDKGYCNFEMNCCGVLLTYYIEDPTPKGDRFVKYTVIPWEAGREVKVYAPFQGPIAEEITDPVAWELRFSIPFSFFERFVGPLGDISGQTWRANFQKCAFGCSHPHGASWADLGGIDDFHQPSQFGIIHFE